ncbi:PREDICTED: spermatid-specific manchette-related protein 1 [Calidris pugnax]|uniref:spermatid-specific manchette-related protein 1 n=1 Tax=Calidris pugnax TaxID=198806 RepID=UPI00071C2E97|nr:PREDICTED: spermatid-specific manchette-related protein 1 [Calidris pugnax]
MFPFSKKHKTPISTYTDSYRPPCTIKKTLYKHIPQPLWRDNNFVTKGLTVPPVQNPASQSEPEHLINVAMQEYYRNTIKSTAYWTDKYLLARSEEKYKPVFVNEGKYITWRATPYNSAAWNKHCCYLPLLPRVTRVETSLNSLCVPYPLRSTCLSEFEKELVANVPLKLPLYTTTGRGCFHGYYSPWSGRHYWLRGIDYYVDGNSAIRRHLRALGERAKYPVLRLQPHNNVVWDSTFFMTTGGPQRASYVIHPEFASEASSALCHW